MNVWFVSDTHFGHSRVIEYSNRPFSSVEEMDEAMIENWNEVVKPGDLVYHLGDFSFYPEAKSVTIASRLAGNRYLVYGNHDKRLRKNKDFVSQWIWTKDLTQIELDGQKIILCHFAMLTWNQSHRNPPSWQLHGHSHGSLPDDPHAFRTDVGVDCWNYAPVSFEEIRKLMSKKTYQPVDHHGQRSDR